MKLLPILLLNVATVGVALVVYEQLRAQPQQPMRIEGTDADTDALRKRVEMLENDKRPLLRSNAPDPRLAKRLDALEAEVRAKKDAVFSAKPAALKLAPANVNPELVDTVIMDLIAPTMTELHRFRQVRKAVDLQDKMARARKRVDATLNKLALNLNDTQRAKIHNAHAAFASRSQAIWDEVKTQARQTAADGGRLDRKEIVAATQTRIQTEFAATLGDVVSTPDAEAIATALHPVK